MVLARGARVFLAAPPSQTLHTLIPFWSTLFSLQELAPSKCNTEFSGEMFFSSAYFGYCVENIFQFYRRMRRGHRKIWTCTGLSSPEKESQTAQWDLLHRTGSQDAEG